MSKEENTKKKAKNNKTKVENKKNEKKEVEVKEEVKSSSKIKEIEEKSKNKKLPKEKTKKSFSQTVTELDEKRKIIYGFIGGLLLGLLIMVMFTPKRIATLKDGQEPIAKLDGKNITSNELYTMMKNHYSVSLLLDKIDTDILTKLYPEDDEMKETVNSTAENYLNQYKQYGYTEEQFLSSNGFSNYNDFLDYLKLDYRRRQYEDKYVEDNLTDKEIEKYYNDNVFGDINCQHLLVTVKSDDDSEGLTDEEAKALAEEIITKINDGTSWDDIKEQYKDKTTFEDLKYQSWDASLEESFLKAIKEMDENSYSKEPTKTSYGYHVIHTLDKKEKPTLKDAKETIIEKLVSEKKSEDTNLLYKALIALRKEHKLEFTDTDLEDKYKTYCKEYE